VKFVFGIQAMQSLYVHAENLPRNAWKELSRPAKYDVKTEPRQRPTNVKQQVVEERKFTAIRLAKEHVAEFRYRPGKCDRDYRIVVVWKDLEVDRLADLVPPPRKHRHRYHGVFAPNHKLRPAVTAHDKRQHRQAA
jgi:hypothetical protein